MSTRNKKKPKCADKETTDVGMSDMPDNPEDMLAKFEQELVWCIEQLQLGLETQNASSRQAVEATKALKILLSAKAPMIKKRQVMRNTFGDYRKKMAEMECKSSAAVRKGTIAPVVTKNMQKSTFFKKSATRNSDGVQSVPKESDGIILENHSTACDKMSAAQSSETVTCNDLNNSFQFSFKIDDHNRSENVTCSDFSPNIATINNKCDGNADTNVSFSKGDNSFRFNFTPPS